VNTVKSRTWGFIIYPESLPEDWKDQLEALHLPIVVSPLHDSDTDKGGRPLKPHYHVLVIYPGPTTESCIKRVIDGLNVTGSLERIYDANAYCKYMTHETNPDKAQYDKSDMLTFGGANLEELMQPSKHSKYETVGQIIDFCKENGITEYSELMEYSRDHRETGFFCVLIEYAFCISRYLTSKRVRHERERNRSKNQTA